MKGIRLTLVVLLMGANMAGRAEVYTCVSPNGKAAISLDVSTDGVSYSVAYDGKQVVAPSRIGVTIETQAGSLQPVALKSKKAKKQTIDQVLTSNLYTKKEVEDHCNELELSFRNGFGLKLRAYDDGVAYRWIVTQKEDYVVSCERAEFQFAQDAETYLAYINSKVKMGEQVQSSFENTYQTTTIAQVEAQNLGMIPFAVRAAEGVVCAVTEADVEEYPNMNVYKQTASSCLEGYFAGYPKTLEQGGHKNGQMIVEEREDYLALGKAGTKLLPWRVIALADDDSQLLENDLVYCLASPSRIEDVSWIRPGLVSWDWWNDWGLTGVDFVPGINTETYKAHIDFASKYGIPYIIIDDGWEVNGPADLFQVVPEIDLEDLVAYGREKGVDVILWATYYSVYRDVEAVFKHYSEMGIAGFKIDFMNRDDAQMVTHLYEIAEMAAKYKLTVDYHGMYKPAGMNRTYPNVLNFEGVAGLEQNKWATIREYDQVTYDVMIPYLRMFAGPMDYTQGAMLNATQESFHPSDTNPMSQGTRVHQLAEYVVFFSPLNMLCDAPSLYEQNSECTEFISSVPTVWDETRALSGKIGDHVAVARCSGETWYVGVLGNWQAKTVCLDLSQIGAGGKIAEVFEDGTNANKRATDYRHQSVTLPADGKVEVHLANGGGCVLVIK